MKPIRVFNTLGRRLEVFEPYITGRVGMYTCGPTVYDYTHIGHARTFTAFDAMKRYLWLRGYSVLHVQNITDIDDKIINRAREEGRDWKEIVDYYTKDYLEMMEKLNIRIDIHPRVTSHIKEIIEFVESLIEKGYAYATPSGNVYFEVDKYPDYGRLSRRTSREAWRQEEEYLQEKKKPYDFALWKAAKPGEPSWESPWGPGRPGWHIECSVMSMRYLGRKIDIHGGGVDLVFPHHENERAQSEALTGEKWVKYWLHVSYLTIRGEKMSKSLGNIIPLREALAKWGSGPLRLWLLSSHYRHNLDYSEEALKQYTQLYNRLRAVAERVARRLEKSEPSHYLEEKDLSTLGRLRSLITGWHEAMSNDFNFGAAAKYLWEFTTTYFREVEASESSALLSVAWKFIVDTNRVYAYADDIVGGAWRVGEGLEEPLIDLIVEVRSKLREKKMYDLADYIRERLAVMGIQLLDYGLRTEWRRVEKGK
ncbi:MAG: cysteine--tRNA ligase [Desulfurococcales archaeon]|nr:cysteine--tRNA ligase [Desulfurococcales archaeon]